MTETFLAARTVDEAVEAMAGGARAIAGGTDLVVAARQGKAALPESLVAIHRLDDLRGISAVASSIRLGALATHAEVARHPIVRERYSALADACAIVGSEATRIHGTVGGNLMNASPAMEIGGPLICFDASVTMRSADGTRQVAVADLFVGPGETSARPGELLTAVALGEPATGTGSSYARLEYRRQMEIAVVGAACMVVLDSGRISEARIAITALAPTIRRVPEAEVALAGSDGGRSAAQAAAGAAAEASQPISDVRASAEYRRAMAAVVVRRVIEAAVARARGEVLSIPASQTLYGAV
jgi:CO/xanthine dehydrogenase FAD-binding subunit